jgi:hypothetical protein
MFSKTLTLASRNFKKVKVKWRGSTSGQPSLQDGQPATGDPQIVLGNRCNFLEAVHFTFLATKIPMNFHFSFFFSTSQNLQSWKWTLYYLAVVVESEWMTKEVLIRIFSSSFFSQASRISWSCVLTENWGGRKVPRTPVWTVIKTPSVLCLLWKKKIKGKKRE